MAIPDRPLEITLDVNNLTLDEATLLTAPEEIPDERKIPVLRSFLISFTSWTPAEVGRLKMSELGEVSKAIVEAVQRQALPLANSTSSKTGPDSTTEPSLPDGS